MSALELDPRGPWRVTEELLSLGPTWGAAMLALREQLAAELAELPPGWVPESGIGEYSGGVLRMSVTWSYRGRP